MRALHDGVVGHTRVDRGEKLVFGGLAVAARAGDGSSVQVTLEVDGRPAALRGHGVAFCLRAVAPSGVRSTPFTTGPGGPIP